MLFTVDSHAGLDSGQSQVETGRPPVGQGLLNRSRQVDSAFANRTLTLQFTSKPTSLHSLLLYSPVMKVAAALLAATAAVAQASDINPLILGGSIVPVGQKTYTVGLRQTATGGAVCGGSLITPTHVLTAGHCSGFISHASVGSHFRGGSADGEVIRVTKDTRHPKYIYDQLIVYDYAILELETPSSVTPVKLFSADSETFVGQNATVMGWGRTSAGGPSSRELLRVDVGVRSDKDCKAAKIRGPPIMESMFCAGGIRNKDGCQGDSGGPLIHEQSSGDVLVGVVSWGESCGLANKPGVYSKVSFQKDWILENAPGAEFV
jgi:secreted trypsin-like serine protease